MNINRLRFVCFKLQYLNMYLFIHFIVVELRPSGLVFYSTRTKLLQYKTMAIYKVSQKHRERLVCGAGRQADYFSRRNLCPEPHGLGSVEQCPPTRGTRATSGTRILPKWHTKSIYKCRQQEFTIFWKYLPPCLFPALPDMALRYRCRFGSTYICEKTVSIMNLVKSKYRSVLTDHHLKNLLILATSSINPDIE